MHLAIEADVADTVTVFTSVFVVDLEIDNRKNINISGVEVDHDLAIGALARAGVLCNGKSSFFRRVGNFSVVVRLHCQSVRVVPCGLVVPSDGVVAGKHELLLGLGAQQSQEFELWLGNIVADLKKVN